MESYKIRLPNGTSLDREMEKEEVEYWISLGMFLSNGFQIIMTMFAAEQMDDAANVQLPEAEEEVSVN